MGIYKADGAAAAEWRAITSSMYLIGKGLRVRLKWVKSTNNFSQSLREYRKHTVASFLKHLCEALSFQAVEVAVCKQSVSKLKETSLRIRVEPINSEIPGITKGARVKPLIIGDVTTGFKSTEDKKGFLTSIYASRLDQCKKIVDQAEFTYPFTLDNLVRATVHWELLSRKREVTITIPSDSCEKGPRALFYNFNRVCSILATFDNRVSSGYYNYSLTEGLMVTQLWRCTDLDIHGWNAGTRGPQSDTLVVQAVLDAMLDWPLQLCKAIELFDATVILSFINSFNESFTKYYNTVHVLAPLDAPHKFQEMLGHIYIYEVCKDMMTLMFKLLLHGNTDADGKLTDSKKAEKE